MTPVVREAKNRAPRGDRAHKTYRGRLVAPGFLSRNIKKKTFKSRSGSFASASVSASTEAFYGTQFVERGTKYNPAQKWLGPAFLSKKNDVLKRFNSRLRKKINDIAKKS